MVLTHTIVGHKGGLCATHGKATLTNRKLICCRDSTRSFWHDLQRLLCTSNAKVVVYRLRSIGPVDQKLDHAARSG